jgi:hypothetical protein
MRRSTSSTVAAPVPATTSPDEGIANQASDSLARSVLPSAGARAPAQTQKSE